MPNLSLKVLTVKVEENLHQAILEKQDDLNESMSNTLRILISAGLDALNADGDSSNVINNISKNAHMAALTLLHELYVEDLKKIRLQMGK